VADATVYDKWLSGDKKRNMNRIFFLLVIVAAISLGCKKEAAIPNGDYSGTFTRSSPNTNTVSSDVTLHISGKQFSGAFDMTNYPAICNGGIEFKGSKVTVSNACMFTANFDWSFIFGGDYDWRIVDKELIITRSYANGSIDSYNLHKVK
jgi:hypothetical protein